MKNPRLSFLVLFLSILIIPIAYANDDKDIELHLINQTNQSIELWGLSGDDTAYSLEITLEPNQDEYFNLTTGTGIYFSPTGGDLYDCYITNDQPTQQYVISEQASCPSLYEADVADSSNQQQGKHSADVELAGIDGFIKTPFAAIPGHNTATSYGIDLNQCALRCQGIEWCRSFDYKRFENTCYLSDQSREKVALKHDYDDDPFDYYHRKVQPRHRDSGNTPLQQQRVSFIACEKKGNCTYEQRQNPFTGPNHNYIRYANSALFYNNHKQLTAISVDACLNQCEQSTWCRSVDYNKDAQRCQLSAAIASEVGGMVIEQPWTHYMRVSGGPYPPQAHARHTKAVRGSFARWLKREQPPEKSLTKRVLPKGWGESGGTPYTGQSNRIKTANSLRKGYHLFKMNPEDLSDTGTKYRIFEEHIVDQWYEGGPFTMSIPNEWELYDALNSVSRVSKQIFLSSDSVQKSRGWSVGVGGSIGAKQPAEGKRAKGAGSLGVQIGSRREETSARDEESVSIRSEKLISYYWAHLIKRHVRLDDNLIERLTKPSAFKNNKHWDKLFEDFGTHWPLGLLIGGKVIRQDTMSHQSFSESLTKTLSVKTNASIPIKAATLDLSHSYDESTVKNSMTKQGKETSVTKATGGADANFDFPAFGEVDSSTRLVPIGVELRPLHELLWPELLGATTPREVLRYDKLRAEMKSQLERYIQQHSISPPQYDWRPKVYRLTIKKAVVVYDDDGAAAGMADVAGFISLYESSNTLPKGASDTWAPMPLITQESPVPKIIPVNFANTKMPWRVADNATIDVEKGDSFDLDPKESSIMMALPPVSEVKSGRARPFFPKDRQFLIHFSLSEWDKQTSDNAYGVFTVPLSKIDSRPGRVLHGTLTIETPRKSIKIKISYTAERVNYTLADESLIRGDEYPSFKAKVSKHW